FWCFILLFCFSTSFQFIYTKEECFRAAVYESVLIKDKYVWLKQEEFKHLEVYNFVAKQAAKNGSQTIVFPEHGLAKYYDRNKMYQYSEEVTNEKAKTKTIRSKTNSTKTKLYCKRYVANMVEVEFCSPNQQGCPSDGRFQYKTAIAFDSNGTILTKYRKYHLFGEIDLFNKPNKQEFSTFDTPFGKFGMLICFDSLFKDPKSGLIEEHGASTFTMPTWWYSLVNLNPDTCFSLIT
ncbi:vascular non-inflammatory molecule 3-like protein, partial [Leptotrombidium deliense]